MSVEIVTSESDSTAPVNKFRVKGTDYKYDYNALLNRPGFIEKELGTAILETTDVVFQQQQSD